MARTRQTGRLKTAGPIQLELAAQRAAAELAAAQARLEATDSDEEVLYLGTTTPEPSAMADRAEEPLSPKSTALAQFAATAQEAVGTVIAASQTLAADLTAAQELAFEESAGLQARLTEVETELEKSQQEATAAEAAQEGLKTQLADLESQLKAEKQKSSKAEGEQHALEKACSQLQQANTRLEEQLEEAQELQRTKQPPVLSETEWAALDPTDQASRYQQLAAENGILLVQLKRMQGQLSEQDKVAAAQMSNSAAAATAGGPAQEPFVKHPSGQPWRISSQGRRQEEHKLASGGAAVPSPGKSSAAQSRGRAEQPEARPSPKSTKDGGATSQHREQSRGRSPEHNSKRERRPIPSPCRRDSRSHSRSRSRSPAALRDRATAGRSNRQEYTKQQQPLAHRDERPQGGRHRRDSGSGHKSEPPERDPPSYRRQWHREPRRREPIRLPPGVNRPPNWFQMTHEAQAIYRQAVYDLQQGGPGNHRGPFIG